MKKKRTKGFKWSGWKKPVDAVVDGTFTVYTGNFCIELILPNALKIKCMDDLLWRLKVYMDKHGGNHPDQFTCTKKQIDQYRALLLWPTIGIPLFYGIPLKTRKI